MEARGSFLRRKFGTSRIPARTTGIGVVMLGLWLIVAVLLGSELQSSYSKEWNSAHQAGDNLAILLERQLTGTVQRLDLVLRNVRDDYQSLMTNHLPPPPALVLNRRLHDLQIRVPEVLDTSLRIVGKSGETLYQAGEDSRLPTANIADRDYFIRQLSSADAGLLMSQPLQSRFFDGAWLLSFSRRLEMPDGRFAGLVMASLKISNMQSTLDQLRLGEHGVVGLYDSDMHLIARSPLGAGRIGQKYNIEKDLPAALEQGSFTKFSAVDGQERLYLFRRLDHIPMTVLVGLAPMDFLAEWRNKAMLFGLALAMMGGLCGALFLQLRRHDRLAQRHMDHLVTHDLLTQLPNRLDMEAVIEESRNDSRPKTLLTVDIEGFKMVNDVLGHEAGDKLLCVTAERLRDRLPPNARLWRHGGDEFAVLLEGPVEPQKVFSFAEDLMAALSAPVTLAHQEIEVSASMGIASNPPHGQDLGELLRGAEVAMSDARSKGHSTIGVFSENLRSAMSERMLIETHLRKAVARDQLRLFYQPQYDLLTGHLTGFEALVRWQHPDMGMISPARFIPVAEESGLIVGIGEWVLDEACRQTRQWHGAGLPKVQMAVNLAAQQFRQANLLDQISASLRHHGLAPDYLLLEVTESSLILNVEQVIATLGRMKSFGLSVAIDDFGIGYSSLSYLQQFPIDKIKIDQSFVRGMMESSGDSAIVQSVIAIAESMEMKTLAEGVETSDQLNCLRDLGCNEVQGFFYSKPVPAAEAERFLRAEMSPPGHG